MEIIPDLAVDLLIVANQYQGDCSYLTFADMEYRDLYKSVNTFFPKTWTQKM